ncbi:hypothetical protein BOX15_Mlig012591g1, partial [Macrostomum lignano]
AVFGFQLVVTLVSASVLSTISRHYSLGRRVLLSLRRFKPPSDRTIAEAANIKKSPKTDRDGVFLVAKSVRIPLVSTRQTELDLRDLHFYSDWQWLLDFSLIACIVYGITEFYYGALNGGKSDRTNLSLVWCCLGVGFALKGLLSIVRLYSANASEFVLLVTFAFFYTVMSMGVLVLPPTVLQLGLDSPPLSDNQVLRACLVLIGGFYGALVTFSAIRHSRVYWDLVSPDTACLETDSAAGLMDTMSRRLTLLLHHLSFYAPLGCLLTWFVPVRRGITAVDLCTVQVYAVLLLCLLRLVCMPGHLQAFLHSASTRLARLNREAGRISNRDLQEQVSNVNRFLGVISLQYLCPLAVTLFLALMYKTLSGCSWDSGRLSGHLPLYNLARANATSQSNTSTWNALPDWLKAYTDDPLVADLTSRVDELRSLASPQTAGGLLSYGLFWSLFCTFVTSMFGLGFHTQSQL